SLEAAPCLLPPPRVLPPTTYTRPPLAAAPRCSRGVGSPAAELQRSAAGSSPRVSAATPPSPPPPTRYSRPSRATRPPAERPWGSGARLRQRSPSRRASWVLGRLPSLPPATYRARSRVAAMAWLTATGRSGPRAQVSV